MVTIPTVSLSMRISLTLLIFAFLFLSAVLSGVAAFLFDRQNKTFLKLLLAFSGAYLFAICVLHLIPEIYISA